MQLVESLYFFKPLFLCFLFVFTPLTLPHYKLWLNHVVLCSQHYKKCCSCLDNSQKVPFPFLSPPLESYLGSNDNIASHHMSYIHNNVAKNNKIKQAYIFVDCFCLYDICNLSLVMWYLHTDDVICKITSPLFCFLVDSFASERSNFIHQITSKRYRCPDVIFIYRSKEYYSTGRQGTLQSHLRV